MARAGDARAHVATLDALAAVDAPRLLAHVLPAALDAMRRAHEEHPHRQRSSSPKSWAERRGRLDQAEVEVVEA
eukprot:CAMPEP_0197598374 /NCGR_PEP_ID=MMETSP1326-20131121/29225_1 /TAXON_ID=1155430 /ORGANISM="Genus nov. species nov., Strain RCC2288" /LENGTH=73 /DNA_ID=CAMNT_0043165173 /DNA_START=15 /DNA_END=233 /DNA_ORIENTATION=+